MLTPASLNTHFSGERKCSYMINEQMCVHWLLSSVIQGHGSLRFGSFCSMNLKMRCKLLFSGSGVVSNLFLLYGPFMVI